MNDARVADRGKIAPASAKPGSFTPALIVLTSLFFMRGLITSLNDILIPHLKAVFTLSYVQAIGRRA
jgi:FHS family L-fucose permease-like MFS transporter